MCKKSPDSPPNRRELVAVLIAVTAHLDIAERMLDNALNLERQADYHRWSCCWRGHSQAGAAQGWVASLVSALAKPASFGEISPGGSPRKLCLTFTVTPVSLELTVSRARKDTMRF